MSDGVLDGLPPTFTYSQARRHGMSDRALYQLRGRGMIQPLGRGLYRRADAGEPVDVDLLEISYRAPEATLCLTSALARHGLTDLIPSMIDVALPRGRRQPQVRAPVAWHKFDPDTFDVGRQEFGLDDQVAIGLYDAQRCIIDAFRMRHLEGPELGHIALRRWLTWRGAQPSALLTMASQFPNTERALREAMEILL